MDDRGIDDSRFQDRFCFGSSGRRHDAYRFAADSVGDLGGGIRIRGDYENRSIFGRLQMFDPLKRRFQVTGGDRFDHMACCPVNRRGEVICLQRESENGNVPATGIGFDSVNHRPAVRIVQPQVYENGSRLIVIGKMKAGLELLGHQYFIALLVSIRFDRFGRIWIRVDDENTSVPGCQPMAIIRNRIHSRRRFGLICRGRRRSRLGGGALECIASDHRRFLFGQRDDGQVKRKPASLFIFALERNDAAQHSGQFP